MVDAALRSLLVPILEFDVDGSANRKHSGGRPPMSRRETLRQAKTLLSESTDLPIHVTDLAKRLDIS